MHNAHTLEKLMFSRALSRSVKSAILIAVCTLSSGAVLGDSPDAGTVAVKVDSTGLDLNTSAGARSMFSRLTVAAQAACGVEAEFDALRTAQFENCYKNSLSNAVRALNHPAVTHVYVAHYPSDATRYGITDGSSVATR